MIHLAQTSVFTSTDILTRSTVVARNEAHFKDGGGKSVETPHLNGVNTLPLVTQTTQVLLYTFSACANAVLTSDANTGKRGARRIAIERRRTSIAGERGTPANCMQTHAVFYRIALEREKKNSSSYYDYEDFLNYW